MSVNVLLVAGMTIKLIFVKEIFMGKRNYDNEKENEEIRLTRAKIFIPLALLWGVMIMLTILSKMQF